MTRVVLRGFAARKLRVILTAIAIALGVALMAGTYIFTDTINSSFASIFQTSEKGDSVVITPHLALGRSAAVGAPNISQATLEKVRAVPGVAKVSGDIFQQATLLSDSGSRLNPHGSSFVGSLQPEPFRAFSPLHGGFPASSDETSIDQATASRYGLKVGDTIQIAGSAPAKRYTISGILKFAGSQNFGGAGVALLTLPEAQRVVGEPDQYDSINVQAQPGVSDKELRGRIRAVLPASLDVRTGAEQAAQETSDLENALGFLRTLLLIFAYVALFVGAFIIFNTFSITVAQRTREFGLLRTLGATRGQLLRSVVAEGILLGLLGSALGLLAGVVVAPALDGLFKSFGADLPDTGTVLQFRTVWVCLLAGTAVTVIAGFAPALRAMRVSPVAALREGVPLERKPRARSVRRRIIGSIVLLVIVISRIVIDATSGGNTLIVILLVLLAIVILVAGLRTGRISILSMAVVPLARLLGRLVTWRGVTGQLARDNTMRQPGRTAVTAAALMIGLALVSFVSILAAGLKASIDNVIDSSFAGDLIVQNSQANGAGGQAGIPAQLSGALARVPGVSVVTPVAFTEGKIAGISGNSSAIAVDPATISRVYKIKWKQGSDATLATLDDDGAVVTSDFATKNHLHVGDRLSVLTPSNRRIPLTVRGIAKKDVGLLSTDLVISLPLARSAFEQTTDAVVFVTFAPGATNAEVQPVVNRLLSAHFPQAESLTPAQFKANQANSVNGLLEFVYVLLTLSIIVALFGIVNTLVLSIYERRRELGMLRAIGMRRRQVRQMIRYESVITALIGGIMGIALGLVIALASTAALSNQGIVLSIPVGTLIILLVLAGLAGVGAAVWPARRAARVDLLEALASE